MLGPAMSSRENRRTVLLLALCQALFMTCTAAIVTSIALTGYQLAENKAFATLPVGLQFLTHMCVTVPASLFMKRYGRQAGFLVGAGIGAVGALTAAYAILEASFTLFCLGSAIIGGFNSIAQFYRFAAADTADETYRPRAISYVLAGGVIASFTGPNLAHLTNDLFAPIAFAGTYVAVIGVQALIALVVLSIRLPRPTESERRASGRPFLEIARQPTFAIAVLGAVVGYVVMSFLMTVTPIAMAECNFTFTDSAFVIQGHVLGMFAPSFITGHLIARFGAINIMTTGAALLVVTVLINLSGIEFLHFLTAMTLLGVGWNFLFIGGTTLLTTCYQPAERAKVQGINDFIIYGCITIGVFASGALQHAVGWTAVNVMMVIPVVVVLGALFWLKSAAARAPA